MARFAAPIVCLLVAPLSAEAAPVLINQNNGRNISIVVQQYGAKPRVVRDIAIDQGRTSYRELITYGPDLDPVIVSQKGAFNRSISVQQGRNPSFEIEQTGDVNIKRGSQRSLLP